MPANPGDGQTWHRLYGDAEVAQLFTDSAEIRAMLLVEGALAEAQGKLGLIPEVSAKVIGRAAREVLIDPGGLAEATARDGVVVPALVAAFRASMEAPEHAAYIHWGATSQDIQDTGLVLRLRRALDIMETRLRAVLAVLANHAEAHRRTVMPARTRWQMATPTTLGARIATWGMPLVRDLERLHGLRSRLLVLSLAGAAGTNAAMSGHGAPVAESVAEALKLETTPVPWHVTRDGIGELAGWLALVNGSLGKMAADLLGSALLEEGIRAGEGGGSSTMPNKANPTGAEALGALAGHNIAVAGQVMQAAVHGFERDGRAWGQESLALPGLVTGSAAALRHAVALAEGLQVDPERLRAVLNAGGGMAFAEAAAFDWARDIPLPDAKDRVKAACATARDGGRDLRAVLEEAAPDRDWGAVFDGAGATGDAAAVADAFVAAARGVAAASTN